MLVTVFLLVLLAPIHTLYAATNKKRAMLGDSTSHAEPVVRSSEAFSIKIIPASLEMELPAARPIAGLKKRSRKKYNTIGTWVPVESDSLHRSPWPGGLRMEHELCQQSFSSINSVPSKLFPYPPQRREFRQDASPTLFFKVNDFGEVRSNCDMIVDVPKPLMKRRAAKGEEILRVRRDTRDIILKAPFDCRVVAYVLGNHLDILPNTLLVKFLIVYTAETQKHFSNYDLEVSVPVIPAAPPKKKRSYLQVPSSSFELQPSASPPESPSSTQTVIRTPPSSSPPQSRSSSLQSLDSVPQSVQPQMHPLGSLEHSLRMQG